MKAIIEARMKEILEAIFEDNVNRLSSLIGNKKEEERRKLKSAGFAFENNNNEKTFEYPDNFGILISILPKSSLTLLHVAAACDSLESFLLIEDSLGLSIDAKSADEYLPIHYACQSGSGEIVSYILEKDPKMAVEANEVKFSQLYLAAHSGNPYIIQQLFENGADLNTQQHLKNNPIDHAINTKNTEALKALLSKGANNDATNLLYELIKIQRAKAIPLILEQPGGVFINSERVFPSKENPKETIISRCISTNATQQKTNIEILEKILPHSNSLTPEKPIPSGGPLHWICAAGSPDIASLIIKKGGFDFYEVDRDKKPGTFKIENYRGKEENIIEILKLLIKNNYDINRQYVLKNGQRHNLLSFLVLASFNKQINVIEFLLKNDADMKMRLNSGRTLIEEVENLTNN